MSSNPLINHIGNPSSSRTVLRLRVRGVLCGWALWLALSLLLSQSLGQLHSVKHGGSVAAAHAAGEHEAHDIHHTHGDESFLDLLFSSHGNASDCRLYDHLNDGQSMPLIVAAPLPIVLPSRLVAIFAGDALARWAALFDARGPPLTV
jgi:hypothetical protein